MIAGFLAVTLLPLAILAAGVRREMHTRVIAQNERRAQALAAVITQEMDEVHRGVGAAVSRVAAALPDDARFRAGVLRPESTDRGYVLDYAARAMAAADLSVLQIQNDSGRIVSSGHFPAEFDRVDAHLPDALGGVHGPVLLTVRTAADSLTVLARIDSIEIAGRTFTAIGGRAIDQAFIDRLDRGDDIRIGFVLPDGRSLISQSTTMNHRPTDPRGSRIDPIDRFGLDVLRSVDLTWIDARSSPPSPSRAQLSVLRAPGVGDELRRSIDRWIIGAFPLATVGAVLAALWVAGRLSRPMEELAAATAIVDLDRLDVRFAADRDDEIGVLSRRLTAMVNRLRASAARVREAERRATVGEIARQVNHDIKNGLAPIRNVVRHLAQVAHEQPAELPAVFAARQGTLESSIGYLETLARNYARLSPSLAVRPTDVGSVVEEVVAAVAHGTAIVRATVARALPAVLADAVVVRRILENVVGNAVDSLDGKPGEVRVSALLPGGTPPAGAGGDQRLVRLVVEDTGRGMTEAELARAFDDFHTTKPHGTGLGLSVVRRLVADLGGTLRIETQPGVGTRVQIDLPAAPASPVAVRPALTPTR